MTHSKFAARTLASWAAALRTSRSTRLAVALASLVVATPAVADAPEPTPEVVAETTAPENAPAPTDSPAEQPTGPITTLTTNNVTPTEEPSKFGGSLSVETSIGLGTFVSGPQENSVVTTSFSPSAYYQLAKDLRLNGSLSLTWYQVLDVDTPLAEGDALLSDISLGVSHGRIYHHEDSGFNVSGNLRVGLPTSLASQFQNRLFTLSTAFTASIPVGPVSFSYTLGFGKYFNLTATPTVDCEDFEDPEECISGRDANPNFGFESERRGPEVYLPGAGATSFYLQNSLGISWTIIDELSLSFGLAISNSYGVRSFPKDDLSGDNATSGRSHRDRLSSSLGLDYTINKHFSVGASLTTDTSTPFGADGNDFPVVFDFSRASDNITSFNISVTGSL